jgi:hypothetical protein
MTNQGHIYIKLDANGIRMPLVKLLGESLENVKVGLIAVQRYSPRHEQLPGFVEFGYSEADVMKRVPRKEIWRRRDNFRTWILARGFEECSKALIAALGQAYQYVEIVKLAASTVTTEQELVSKVTHIKRRSAHLNFPSLIEGVTKQLLTVPTLTPHVESINKTRNCLEHRDGIVQSDDVNDAENNSLTMSWRYMSIVVGSDESGWSQIKFGDAVQGPAQIGVLAVEASKSFAVGERIDVSAAEFNAIAFTCQSFVEEIIANLPLLPTGPGT